MKNLQNPFKLITIFGIVLTLFGTLAFSNPDNQKTTTKLIVTSNSEATFDFSIISVEYEKGRKDFLNQTTPFEMEISSENCKILLKKISGNSLVNFKVTDATGSIEATWPTTVILVNGDSKETFGL